MDFLSGRNVYNTIKRDIKTFVLRHLSKRRHRGTGSTTQTTEHRPRVFVEIGTGHRAEWTYLIRDNWRDLALRKHQTDPLRSLPDPWCAAEGHWHGYLVEAHPGNFSQLVEKTVADPHLRPFLHRLTFINAAISGASGFSTMGIETGALKGLFVNRFALKEAHPFHLGVVKNAVDFGIFTVSLQTLLDALGHEQIDILRMDTEGAEVSIFKTYSFQIKPRMLSVECHSEIGETFVRHILEKQGYQIDVQNAEELRGALKGKRSVEETHLHVNTQIRKKERHKNSCPRRS